MPANRIVLLAAMAVACGNSALQRAHATISADPQAIDFGTQTAGVKSTQTLKIHNTSQFTLNVSSVGISGDARGAFSLGPAPAMIAAGDTAPISVTYTAPAPEGADGAALTIFSNADNAPELSVSLSGRSVKAVVNHTLTVVLAGNGSGTVSGGGLSCSPTCTGSIVEGSTVTLTASAAANSRFAGFSGACSGATCSLTMSADATVTATFVATYDVNVAFAGTGSGTVDFAGAATACIAACTRTFDAGTNVSVSGTAGASSFFSGFSGDCTGTSSCSVSAAKSITATFVATHSLTVQLAGSGSGTASGSGISCPGTCSVTAPEGAKISLSAAASSGSRFDAWSGACTGASCSFTMGTNDTTATATFVQQYTLALTFAGDGGGTVDFGGAATACTASCSRAFDIGTALTVTGTAASTNVFTGFTGDDTGNPSFSIASLGADASVTATFQQTHAISVSVVGSGSVSSIPAGISACTSSSGVCSATFTDGVPVTLTATASASTFQGWTGAGCSGTSTCGIKLAGADASTTATFAAATAGIFGGANDQIATGIAYASGALWVSGSQSGGSAAGGLVAKLSLPIDTPDFVNVWPATGATTQDSFSGIAASGSAIYAFGQSYSMTTDCSGGKEAKMAIVKYPLATTGAPSGYEWFSNVGGSCAIESLAGGAVAVESGTTYLYGAGMAQYPNRDTLIKAGDATGNPTVMPSGSSTTWTQFFTTTGNAGGFGIAPFAAGGGVYVVGADNDTPPTYPILAAYDTAGTQSWVVRGSSKFAYSGFFRAVTASGTAVYAVGQTAGSNTDYVIEKYDTTGARQWTKQYDCGSGCANDVLTAVVVLGSHVYAVGYTGASATSGCNSTTPCKGVLLDLNAADGTLLNTTLDGDGTNDESWHGITTDGTDLYVAGQVMTASNGYDIIVKKYAGPLAGPSIGGTVTGLSGSGFVLQNGATGEALPISANGTFTFATGASSYAVSIQTAPTNPDSTAQSCTVTNGSGTASANVTNIQVDCTPWNVATSLQGPSTLHVAGSRVYFATAASNSCYNANSGDAVWVVPASGGTPQKIADIDHYAGNCGVYGLVTDSSFVYWLNYADAWIKKANLDGTGATSLVQVAGQYGNALAIDAPNGNLFYHAYGSATIGRVGVDGSGNTSFANTASINGQNLATDASYLYWTDSPAGDVYKVALGTTSLPASPAPLFSGESSPFGPFVTSSTLYWIAGTALRTAALPSGPAGNFTTGLSTPNSVVADANDVWALDPGAGVVYKIPASGGTPVAIAKSIANSGSLVTDGTHLYFTTLPSATTGTITMILK